MMETGAKTLSDCGLRCCLVFSPVVYWDFNVKWKEVVINGATKEIGKAAIVAVTRARGMEVAGAIDANLVGQDAGKVL